MVQNLNIDLVKTVKILIPLLSEQQRIIAKLDALSKDTESFIRHQSAGQEILTRLEPSFFHEAFLSKY